MKKHYALGLTYCRFVNLDSIRGKGKHLLFIFLRIYPPIFWHCHLWNISKGIILIWRQCLPHTVRISFRHIDSIVSYERNISLLKWNTMNFGDACICIINTDQDERNKQEQQQKKTPTGFPPEGKPSVVILQDEWALRLRRDIQCISDMLCALASLPNALAWIEIDVQDPLQKAWCEAEKKHLPHCFYSYRAHLHHLQSIRDSHRLLGGIKAGFTSQFLYISISFMETVFHANKIQMCSLTPSFQQPTARDLILKTFGWVKRMPSYKM